MEDFDPRKFEELTEDKFGLPRGSLRGYVIANGPGLVPGTGMVSTRRSVLEAALVDRDRHQKSRENRLRRAAARQGLRLVKSHRRDPRAVDFGRYWLADRYRNTLVLGGQFGSDLDSVEGYLIAERIGRDTLQALQFGGECAELVQIELPRARADRVAEEVT